MDTKELTEEELNELYDRQKNTLVGKLVTFKNKTNFDIFYRELIDTIYGKKSWELLKQILNRLK